MRQLLSSVQLLLLAGTAAAGTTAVTCAVIDTQGYESVTLFASLGTVTSTGTQSLSAQQGDLANGSDAANIAGADVAGADTDSNKVLAIEIYRPTQRYITPILTRATANTVINGVWAVLSNPSNAPVDNSALITHAVALVSPALA